MGPMADEPVTLTGRDFEDFMDFHGGLSLDEVEDRQWALRAGSGKHGNRRELSQQKPQIENDVFVEGTCNTSDPVKCAVDVITPVFQRFNITQLKDTYRKRNGFDSGCASFITPSWRLTQQPREFWAEMYRVTSIFNPRVEQHMGYHHEYHIWAILNGSSPTPTMQAWYDKARNVSAELRDYQDVVTCQQCNY